jgi:hypothetical protein
VSTKITVEKAPAEARSGRKRASKTATAAAPASGATEVEIGAPSDAEAHIRDSVEKTVLSVMQAVEGSIVALFDGCVENILAQLKQQTNSPSGVPKAAIDAAAARRAKIVIHDTRTGDTIEMDQPPPGHMIVIR